MSRTASLVLAALMSASALGQVAEEGAFVPGLGSPMPYYFEGTYNRASGTVVYSMLFQGQPQYVQWARLRVGGVVVAGYEHQTGEPGLHNVTLGRFFDSTRFPNGFLQIEIEGESNLGRPLRRTASSVVQNNMTAFTHPHFALAWKSNGGANAVAQFDGSNYNTLHIDSDNWADEEFKLAMQRGGVVYVNSHGDVDRHDGAQFPGYFVPSYFVGQGYKETRDWANGSGLPPFNSTLCPPVRLLYLDTCESCRTNVFRTVFTPETDAYGDSYVNQALVGFSGDVQVDQSYLTGSRLFHHMMQGKTVFKARRHLLFESELFPSLRIEWRPDEAADWETLRYPEQMPIWVDHYARIRHVYTGTHDTAPDVWHR